MNFHSKLAKLFIALYFLLKTLLNYYFFSLENLLKSEKKLRQKKISLMEITITCNYQVKLFKLFKIKSCLIKSVALKNMINSFGWEAVLYIGVKKEEELHSHSWVHTNFRDFFKPSTNMKIIRTVF